MSNISQKMDLRQTQSLVMTPQLQQAIKLLQLTNIELSDYLEEELAQNPLLEKKQEEPEGGSANSESQETPSKETERDDIKAEFDQAWNGDDTSDGYRNEGTTDFGQGKGGNTNFENNDYNLENRLSSEMSLRDHLMEQLRMHTEDPRDHMIGAGLSDLLDEGGYLRHEVRDLALRLECSENRLNDLLHIMKGFDPTGIFARDLQECLSMQLEEKGQLDEYTQRLLDHLDTLPKDGAAATAKKCSVSEAYLEDMLEEIKALNPKPAALYDHFIVQTVIPDLVMKKIPNNLGGGWRVELNTDTLPKVLVNESYYTEVAQKTKKDEDKTYLNNQLTAANWLVKALDQRARTITRVGGEIVEQQEAFFLYGVEFLKPLTLKDIAAQVDLHESTISRVTSNKYISTPRGIFELKYFFSPSITGNDGQVFSAESVKAHIRHLIDGEDPENVLSDDAIVEMLSDRGINIARRTVAKYRDLMHIVSSTERRRQKKKKASV